jgi:hypothetical protein
VTLSPTNGFGYNMMEINDVLSHPINKWNIVY